MGVGILARQLFSTAYLCFHVPVLISEGSDWTGVGLDEFMDCQHNLAHNRQTRMLANLSLIGCYNQSVVPNRAARDQAMLDSAKDNLRSIAFFGLTEHQAESRYLFEHTFHLRFTTDFVQYSETHASKADVNAEQQRRLARLNRLDVELYAFAKELFFARLKFARASGDRSEHFAKNTRSSNILLGHTLPLVEYEEVEDTYDGESDDSEREDSKQKEHIAQSEKVRQRRSRTT